MEPLGGVAWLEEVRYCGQALTVCGLTHPTLLSPLATNTIRDSDVTSQFPVPRSCFQASATIVDFLSVL